MVPCHTRQHLAVVSLDGKAHCKIPAGEFCYKGKISQLIKTTVPRTALMFLILKPRDNAGPLADRFAPGMTGKRGERSGYLYAEYRRQI